MAMTVDEAKSVYEQMLRNFSSPIRNNATAGSLGTRNEDEQRLGEAARTLMKYGVMYRLKRKYRGR